MLGLFDILFLPYFFIALSILSLWIKKHVYIYGSLLFISFAFGIFLGRIDIWGILFIFAFGILIYLHAQKNFCKYWKFFSFWGVLLFSLAAFLHILPGFMNWQVICSRKISPDAIFYSMYLNFDKSLLGFFLILFLFSPINSWKEWKSIGRVLPMAFLGMTLILALSFWMGYIRFDPKLPDFFLLWMIKNLFFTCIAEEALFRGFIQKKIIEVYRQYFGKFEIIGLFITSLLFGLAHFQGGVKYVILSSVAGFFYGFIYWKTEKIESSILLHFSLNFLHFMLFSYPCLGPR